MGIATTNITAHVTALMPVTSLNTPAMIPPTMPPTSKSVDKSALSEASKDAELMRKQKTVKIKINNVYKKILTGCIDVPWQPEKKGIVDELGEEEAQGEFNHALFERSTDVCYYVNYASMA